MGPLHVLTFKSMVMVLLFNTSIAHDVLGIINMACTVKAKACFHFFGVRNMPKERRRADWKRSIISGFKFQISGAEQIVSSKKNQR